MSSSTPDSPATPDPRDADVRDAVPAPAGDTSAPAVAADAPEEEPQAAEERQDVTLLVDPDRVRRAPKYPVFLWMGALVGAVVGLIFSTWLIDASGSAESLMKPGVYVSVTVLGGIALGMGVAGLVAVASDRRSLRRR